MFSHFLDTVFSILKCMKYEYINIRVVQSFTELFICIKIVDTSNYRNFVKKKNSYNNLLKMRNLKCETSTSTCFFQSCFDSYGMIINSLFSEMTKIGSR